MINPPLLSSSFFNFEVSSRKRHSTLNFKNAHRRRNATRKGNPLHDVEHRELSGDTRRNGDDHHRVFRHSRHDNHGGELLAEEEAQAEAARKNR